MIRQPIVTIMGHVDHGKTSVLDAIRGTAIAAKEAGGITQAIGASIIPAQTLLEICGDLLERTKLDLTIPGLLFIDTPGHAAFVNLRKRGGSLADIAILVVDITDGMMPQTKESIEILKSSKTPFIIAANKIDMVQGWKQNPGLVLQSFSRQTPQVQQSFEAKLYELVGQVYEMGIQADRFDRVSDYTKQVAIVPVSAKTKEGIPELLMVLTGLAQKYLENALETDVSDPAKGTVLEVKEQKGLGTVLDVILYDGTLKVGDSIVVAALNGAVESKVKALLVPAKHAEMREKSAKFDAVKTVSAANGVRVVAPGTENALAGMRICAVDNNADELRSQISSEVSSIVFESDADGIMVKADSVGSLEALTSMLKEAGIPVRKSGLGPITKKDVSEAESTLEKDPLHSVILGFNIPKPDLQTNAKIICHDVIYQLIDDYEKWRENKKKSSELQEIEGLVKPCKIELLKGYVFRQSNPAVVGVSVASGILKSGTPLMNKEGKSLTVVKGIQVEQENVEKAEKGKNVSVSLANVTIGRQIKEGDTLISAVPENDFRKYKEFREHLSDDDKELLREVAEIMRTSNPLWGI